jgi:CBS domain-containing protein
MSTVSGGMVKVNRTRASWTAARPEPLRPFIVGLVRISEVMTESVVTADCSATLREVGELMRDRNVGSVVICDGGYPAALITDRDLALVAVADGVDTGAQVRDYATRPLVTCESEMDIEEAAALMVQHRVRRLPVLDGDQLAGIVTLDDLAVRSGDVELARQLTSEVAKAALPQFYFHQRGG